MKKLADTNYIQSEILVREFLSSSPSNTIILTDYVAMELYNSGSMETLNRTARALSPFSSQVVVLKGIKQVCGLSGRLAGLQRRLIDLKQTATLPNFFREVEAAAKGSNWHVKGYASRSASAADQLQIVLSGASQNANVYSDFAALFSKEELLAIRKQSGVTRAMAGKILAFTSEVSAHLFEQHPSATRRPTSIELPNTYIFRVSLANTVLALWWVGVGGADSAKPEKLRNDTVDCYLAAYATYFDGVLTSDEKLKDIYSSCRYILAEAFGR